VEHFKRGFEKRAEKPPKDIMKSQFVEGVQEHSQKEHDLIGYKNMGPKPYKPSTPPPKKNPFA